MLGYFVGTIGIPTAERPAMLLIRCTHVLGVLLPFRNACAGHWSVMMHQVTKLNIFKCVHDYKVGDGKLKQSCISVILFRILTFDILFIIP